MTTTYQETESAEVIAEARAMMSALKSEDAYSPGINLKESKGGPVRKTGGPRKTGGSPLIYEHIEADIVDAEAANGVGGLSGRKVQNRAEYKKRIEEEWKKAKGKTIGNTATLEDYVAAHRHMSFYEPIPSSSDIFSSYLGISSDKMSVVNKAYPRMMVNVLRYAIHQIVKAGRDGSYGFEEIKAKIDGKEWLVGSGLKHLVAVQTGPSETVQVPHEPTLGITGRDGVKMCFALRLTYEGCNITVFGKDEKDTEGFLEWLGQQIKKRNFLRKAKIDGKGEFLKLTEHRWEDIVLKPGVRERVEGIMNIFQQEDVYLTNGIPPKLGFALVGPPGTGKTLLTKIMAWALKDVTFIWMTPSSIYGSNSIGDIYELAQELAPTIIFFEDADVYMGARGTMEASGGILTELMNRLDGIVPIKGVVTGISSNRPEVLETAMIRRPGRFDTVIELGPPNEEGRLKLLRMIFSKPDVQDEDVKKLAADERTHNMEPCKLQEVARRAIRKAIEAGKFDKKSLVATVTWQDMQDSLAEYIQEQGFEGNYIQHEYNRSLAEALDEAGLYPLHEQTESQEERIRSFAKLMAPESIEEDDLFDNPIIDSDRVLKVWEDVLEDTAMLRRLGISRKSIRAARKIVDEEDVTGSDVIRMLTGED